MLMKTLGTLERTPIEDVEVGEVYAREGCFEIWCKLKGNKSMLVAYDCAGTVEAGEVYEDFAFGTCMPIYKLPLSVQRLWRTD